MRPIKLTHLIVMPVLLAGCAAQGPVSRPVDDPTGADLSCTLASNCVDSRTTDGLAPLPYTGTPEQAMAALRATVSGYAQATVTTSAPLRLEVIFTTAAGFRDQVDLRIDPARQQIDFRSRSLFGLFDFGKNRARMLDFSARFASYRP